MKEINVEKLNIIELHQLKAVLDDMCEFYSKSIPDYALILDDYSTITPAQKAMLDVYNVVKRKSNCIQSKIEDYVLNKLKIDE